MKKNLRRDAVAALVPAYSASPLPDRNGPSDLVQVKPAPLHFQTNKR